jgi:hypothetical protein
VRGVFIAPTVLLHVVVASLFKVLFFNCYVLKDRASEPIPSPSDPGPVYAPTTTFFSSLCAYLVESISALSSVTDLRSLGCVYSRWVPKTKADSRWWRNNMTSRRTRCLGGMSD